jgi:ABC-type antimicrobial peptide transport system permease subunit
MFASMAAAREREFAVRVALGSTRGAIAALVLQQGAVWMAVGGMGAVFGVAAVSRLLSGQLYGIPPLDLLAIGGSVGIVVACAAAALLAPIRRAARVDPITVLR